MSSQLSSFRSVLSQSRHPVIVAGAGLSAASGIPTFRGPGGYWRQYESLSLATPEAFHRDPSLVWQFYHMRRQVCLKAEPNKAHRTIATLMLDPKARGSIFPNLKNKDDFHLITQNVDGLSIRAIDDLVAERGSDFEPRINRAKSNLLEMHGSLFKTICTSCRSTSPNFDSPICSSLEGTEDQTRPYTKIVVEDLPRCKEVDCDGLLRPGVVWFGESIPLLPKIYDLTSSCDLVLVLGTSSTVYPAASLSEEVKSNGGKVAVFNLEKTREDEADFFFQGGVEETLSWALGLEDETV